MNDAAPTLPLSMSIRHTVVFRLRHEVASSPERVFLADAQRILSAIPGVNDFEVSRQVSTKSEGDFQFSMVFADQAAYDAYSDHEDHTTFVASRWLPEVVSFQEYDFVAYAA